MKLAQIVDQAIRDAVARNGGDKLAAAKELGIGKTTVYRRLNKRRKKKVLARRKRRA